MRTVVKGDKCVIFTVIMNHIHGLDGPTVRRNSGTSLIINIPIMDTKHFQFPDLLKLENKTCIILTLYICMKSNTFTEEVK